MDYRPWILALLVSFSVFTAASAQLTGPGGSHPDCPLQNMPTANDIARFYPKRAEHAGLSGAAVMGCNIQPDGKLSNCRIFVESSPKVGFGEATLHLAPLFRLNLGACKHDVAGSNRFVKTVVWRMPVGPGLDINQFKGQSAGIISISGHEKLTADDAVTCLSDWSKHRCEFHSLSWLRQPSTDALSLSVLKSGKNGGVDFIVCGLGPDRGLTNCQASDVAAIAPIHSFLNQYKAPFSTDDNVPISDGPIAIVLDWTKLFAVALAYQPDPADAPPSVSPSDGQPVH